MNAGNEAGRIETAAERKIRLNKMVTATLARFIETHDAHIMELMADNIRLRAALRHMEARQ